MCWEWKVGERKLRLSKGPAIKLRKTKHKSTHKKIPKKKPFLEAKIKRASPLILFTSTSPICSTKFREKRKLKRSWTSQQGILYNSPSSHHPFHHFLIGLYCLSLLSLLFLYKSFLILSPFCSLLFITNYNPNRTSFILPFHNLFIKT